MKNMWKGTTIFIVIAIILTASLLILNINKTIQKKKFQKSINQILESTHLDLENSKQEFPAVYTYENGKLMNSTEMK